MIQMRATPRLLAVLTAGIAAATFTLFFLGNAYTPAQAAGSTRYASPNGSGSACTQVAPCPIMTAINGSSKGDTVIAAQGVYTAPASSPVVDLTKEIQLLGGWDGTTISPTVLNPHTHPSILDGQGQWRVFRISGNISPTVEGFEVRNGHYVEGAGLFLALSSFPSARPVIRYNRLVNNLATAGWGGGIQVEGGKPVIEHNQVISNSALRGGGMAISSFSQPMIFNNLIIENHATFNGAGIILRDVKASVDFNTIADNPGVGGDGLYAYQTTLTATHNIIVANETGIRFGALMTPTLAYNDVWGNTNNNYIGLSDPTGVNGNISADPLFTPGLFSHYYLSQPAAAQLAASPALDAGNNTAAFYNLDALTTRTDGVPDSGVADLGYHLISYTLHLLDLPLLMR